MMKSKFLIGSMLAGALFAGTGILSQAMAQHMNTPGIDRSQEEIGARIEQGRHAAELENRVDTPLPSVHRLLQKNPGIAGA